jgi:hypothetical protein
MPTSYPNEKEDLLPQVLFHISHGASKYKSPM